MEQPSGKTQIKITDDETGEFLEYRTVPYWDSNVKGLVITQMQSDLRDYLFDTKRSTEPELEIPIEMGGFTLTHTSSGSAITNSVFSTLDDARLGAKIVEDVTDWTSDASRLRNSMEVRQAHGMINTFLREREQEAGEVA